MVEHVLWLVNYTYIADKGIFIPETNIHYYFTLHLPNYSLQFPCGVLHHEHVYVINEQTCIPIT